MGHAKSWRGKLKQFPVCPGCHRPWDQVSIQVRMPGDRIITVTRTKDHIIPRSAGGSSKLSNLQPLCFFCNQSKADRTQEEFEKYMRGLRKRMGWCVENNCPRKDCFE